MATGGDEDAAVAKYKAMRRSSDAYDNMNSASMGFLGASNTRQQKEKQNKKAANKWRPSKGREERPSDWLGSPSAKKRPSYRIKAVIAAPTLDDSNSDSDSNNDNGNGNDNGDDNGDDNGNDADSNSSDGNPTKDRKANSNSGSNIGSNNNRNNGSNGSSTSRYGSARQSKPKSTAKPNSLSASPRPTRWLGGSGGGETMTPGRKSYRIKNASKNRPTIPNLDDTSAPATTTATTNLPSASSSSNNSRRRASWQPQPQQPPATTTTLDALLSPAMMPHSQRKLTPSNHSRASLSTAGSVSNRARRTPPLPPPPPVHAPARTSITTPVAPPKRVIGQRRQSESNISNSSNHSALGSSWSSSIMASPIHNHAKRASIATSSPTTSQSPRRTHSLQIEAKRKEAIRSKLLQQPDAKVTLSSTVKKKEKMNRTKFVAAYAAFEDKPNPLSSSSHHRHHSVPIQSSLPSAFAHLAPITNLKSSMPTGSAHSDRTPPPPQIPSPRMPPRQRPSPSDHDAPVTPVPRPKNTVGRNAKQQSYLKGAPSPHRIISPRPGAPRSFYIPANFQELRKRLRQRKSNEAELSQLTDIIDNLRKVPDLAAMMSLSHHSLSSITEPSKSREQASEILEIIRKLRHVELNPPKKRRSSSVKRVTRTISDSTLDTDDDDDDDISMTVLKSLESGTVDRSSRSSNRNNDNNNNTSDDSADNDGGEALLSDGTSGNLQTHVKELAGIVGNLRKVGALESMTDTELGQMQNIVDQLDSVQQRLDDRLYEAKQLSKVSTKLHSIKTSKSPAIDEIIAEALRKLKRIRPKLCDQDEDDTMKCIKMLRKLQAAMNKREEEELAMLIGQLPAYTAGGGDDDDDDDDNDNEVDEFHGDSHDDNGPSSNDAAGTGGSKLRRSDVRELAHVLAELKMMGQAPPNTFYHGRVDSNLSNDNSAAGGNEGGRVGGSTLNTKHSDFLTNAIRRLKRIQMTKRQAKETANVVRKMGIADDDDDNSSTATDEDIHQLRDVILNPRDAKEVMHILRGLRRSIQMNQKEANDLADIIDTLVGKATQNYQDDIADAIGRLKKAKLLPREASEVAKIFVDLRNLRKPGSSKRVTFKDTPEYRYLTEYVEDDDKMEEISDTLETLANVDGLPDNVLGQYGDMVADLGHDPDEDDDGAESAASGRHGRGQRPQTIADAIASLRKASINAKQTKEVAKIMVNLRKTKKPPQGNRRFQDTPEYHHLLDVVKDDDTADDIAEILEALDDDDTADMEECAAELLKVQTVPEAIDRIQSNDLTPKQIKGVAGLVSSLRATDDDAGGDDDDDDDDDGNNIVNGNGNGNINGRTPSGKRVRFRDTPDYHYMYEALADGDDEVADDLNQVMESLQDEDRFDDDDLQQCARGLLDGIPAIITIPSAVGRMLQNDMNPRQKRDVAGIIANLPPIKKGKKKKKKRVRFSDTIECRYIQEELFADDPAAADDLGDIIGEIQSRFGRDDLRECANSLLGIPEIITIPQAVSSIQRADLTPEETRKVANIIVGLRDDDDENDGGKSSGTSTDMHDDDSKSKSKKKKKSKSKKRVRFRDTPEYRYLYEAFDDGNNKTSNGNGKKPSHTEEQQEERIEGIADILEGLKSNDKFKGDDMKECADILTGLLGAKSFEDDSDESDAPLVEVEYEKGKPRMVLNVPKGAKAKSIDTLSVDDSVEISDVEDYEVASSDDDDDDYVAELVDTPKDRTFDGGDSIDTSVESPLPESPKKKSHRKYHYRRFGSHDDTNNDGSSSNDDDGEDEDSDEEETEERRIVFVQRHHWKHKKHNKTVLGDRRYWKANAFGADEVIYSPLTMEQVGRRKKVNQALLRSMASLDDDDEDQRIDEMEEKASEKMDILDRSNHSSSKVRYRRA